MWLNFISPTRKQKNNFFSKKFHRKISNFKIKGKSPLPTPMVKVCERQVPHFIHMI